MAVAPLVLEAVALAARLPELPCPKATIAAAKQLRRHLPLILCAFAYFLAELEAIVYKIEDDGHLQGHLEARAGHPAALLRRLLAGLQARRLQWILNTADVDR